jgi:predicted DCC family thiol-disulfide oxidoreductase YuxK
MESQPQLSVLYNSACPVCSAEIGHYARQASDAGLPIRFDDLNTGALAQWGLDADQAARRLYVQKDGALVSGVPAFLLLWAELPRYRLLARLVGLPGIRQIACAAYDHVFAPALYSAHQRRLRKQAASTAE